MRLPDLVPSQIQSQSSVAEADLGQSRLQAPVIIGNRGNRRVGGIHLGSWSGRCLQRGVDHAMATFAARGWAPLPCQLRRVPLAANPAAGVAASTSRNGTSAVPDVNPRPHLHDRGSVRKLKSHGALRPSPFRVNRVDRSWDRGSHRGDGPAAAIDNMTADTAVVLRDQLQGLLLGTHP